MRKIFKAITSKKIALLLSASSLILTLSACNTSRGREENHEEPQIEMNLCDTSDICLDRVIQEYVIAYNCGQVTNGTEMYDYYSSLYTKMSEENDEPLSETDVSLTNPEIVTYNFDGEKLNFETLENGTYYIDEEIVKKIGYNNVFVKTIDGSIEIDSLEDSFSIINTNDTKEIVTTLQYNVDGSYSVSEEENSKYKMYEFNSDGILESLYENDKESYLYSKTIYDDGNINVYNVYDVRNDGELGKLIKEMHKDGSYIIYDSGMIDVNRYDYHTNTGYVCDSIKYFYKNNDELIRIETQGETSNGTHNHTFYPNGDYAEYNVFHFEDGSIQSEEKITHDYKNGIINKIIKRKNEENEEFDTIVSILSKNARSPYVEAGTYIPIYESINNIITVQEKDGVIYEYDGDGNFDEAYQVVEDGVIRFDELGNKISYSKDDGTNISYNENGKIKYIENSDYTTYYNDNELISRIENKSDHSIEIEVNEKNYNISSKEYIMFYDNGEEERIEKDGKIFEYDINHNVTSVLENRIDYNTYEKSTSYYDYENNLVSYVNENNIGIGYFENQNIEIIRNYNETECIKVNDLYGNIYELNYQDEIKFRDNGNLESLVKNGIKTVFYDKEDQSHYYVINKEKGCLEYYTNGIFMCEVDSSLGTFGTGTVEDGITRRGIQLKDGTKLYYDEFENDIDELDR